MTSIRHTLGTAALLAAFTGTVLAQAPTQPQTGARHEGTHTHGMTHGMTHGERGARRLEQKMTELKAQLQLAPSQEEAWTQFADAMRAMRQQHTARMDQRAEATKAFYATLTPEQKKRFDERTARMLARHGHHG